MTKKLILWIASLLLITGIVLADAQIVIDPVTKKIYITWLSGEISTWTTQTNTGSTWTIQTISTWTNNTIIAPTITTGSEFDYALNRMFLNGLTKYNTISWYRSNDFLTREEAAKIISQAYTKLWYTTQTINTWCAFKDLTWANPELKIYIQNVCQRGIMKGNAGKFMPNQQLTRPEAMAILVRMF
jgi:hypothetical protein